MGRVVLMECMFDRDEAAAMQRRIGALSAESRPLWGKMSVAQMVAHCRLGVAMASESSGFRPKRILLGRVLGPVIKKMALKDGVPMRKDSPTAKELVMGEGLDFAAERDGLQEAVAKFSSAGAEGCTKYPHAFFGELRPDEWSKLMHKHLDHHLRQFGV